MGRISWSPMFVLLHTHDRLSDAAAAAANWLLSGLCHKLKLAHLEVLFTCTTRTILDYHDDDGRGYLVIVSS